MDTNRSEILQEKLQSLLPRPVSSEPIRSKKTWLLDSFWILVNGISTIVVVFLNKITFTDPQLRNCQIIAAIWHFFVTFLVLYVASQSAFGIFERARLPLLQMLPICILFASFLILNNLSLTFNTVGFFQLAKIMTIPCVVLFNFLLYRRTISKSKLLAVAAACVGVALVSGASVVTNPFGAIIAVSAFVSTALYQLFIAKHLQDHEISAPQLLLNQTPISCAMLLLLVPFFDTLPIVNEIPSRAVASFFVSGFVAAIINLSQFMIIGRTSALAFSIASIVKTIAIMAIGWTLEGKMFTGTDVVGVGLALGGAFMYAQQSK